MRQWRIGKFERLLQHKLLEDGNAIVNGVINFMNGKKINVKSLGKESKSESVALHAFEKSITTRRNLPASEK
ncbi:hypothetical protein VNO77_44583 [Canavalia gladiata]|uniref:Uncharacterized protein n=1 Tax=Canavalia gladiata TaxID=3824 RepID=A0AAN9PQW0_CANGL